MSAVVGRHADLCSKSRYCAECDREVWDVSAMTYDEAVELVQSGRRCIAYEVNERGEPLFAVPPSRLERQRRGVAKLAAVGIVALSGCLPRPLPEPMKAPPFERGLRTRWTLGWPTAPRLELGTTT